MYKLHPVAAFQVHKLLWIMIIIAFFFFNKKRIVKHTKNYFTC